MKFEITITWSKIIALVVLALAFTIDILGTKGGNVFMFSIPFAVFMITGKQLTDKIK